MRMSIRRSRFLFALLPCCLVASAVAQPMVTPAQLLKLAELKPTPKPAYWRPASLTEIKQAPERMPAFEQLVRITQTCNIQAEAASKDLVGLCVQLCKQHGGSIGVWYSPWHRKFMLDAAGKPIDDPDPFDIGPSADAELLEFSARLESVNIWLQQENARLSSAVKVSAYLLDQERLFVRPGDAARSTAIDQKLDAIYERCKYHTPAALVEWYGRGIQPDAGATGWGPYPWNTFTNKADSFSCSLYRVQELNESVETFRRTCAIASGDKDKGKPVTPWIALGWGYQRKLDKYHEAVSDWRYDKTSLWLLSAQINVPWYSNTPQRVERYADWSRAKFVVLYAGPFDARTPAWWEYFIVYVRGATDVKDLSLNDRFPLFESRFRRSAA